MLQPSPPHDPQWLDLITAPASPPSGSAWTRQPGRHKTPRSRPGPVTASPGDHLLHAVAARLLAKVGPDGFPLRESAIDGGTALRVEVGPPLSRATIGIEVVTTGRSAEARARLLLRWE